MQIVPFVLSNSFFCPTLIFFPCLVREPNTFFEDLVAHSCEKVIFAFERSYITSVMRKSMLDVPIPGSF